MQQQLPVEPHGPVESDRQSASPTGLTILPALDPALTCTGPLSLLKTNGTDREGERTQGQV